LTLAQELHDPRAETKALWNLMLLAHYADDDQVQAVGFGERSLRLAREHSLREELAYILHDIANVYLELGRRDEAWATCEEAGVLWQEMSNLPMLVDYLSNSSWHLYQRGDLAGALARVEEGLRISRSIGSLWGQAYSLMTLGPLHLAAGEYGEGIDAIQQAIPLSQKANFEVGHELAAALGGIYGFLGDLSRSVELLQKVQIEAHRREDRLVAALMLALVHVHHGLPAQAGVAFDDAKGLFKAGITNPTLSMYRTVAPVIEAELSCARGAHECALALTADALESTKRRTVAADLRRIQGQALFALGRLEEAHAALKQARLDAQTPDADRMTWLILYTLWSRRSLWKTLFVLTQLEAARENHTEAQTLAGEARAFVTAIADAADALELRGAFLSLPDVKAVLEWSREAR
jgi:tetratricopeptide (TPR) repeat protein